MRWAALLAVLLAAGGGIAWWALSGGSRAVRSTTTPSPPTRAELLLEHIAELERQLMEGEEWREKLYADKTRNSGYERGPAAYQRSHTPRIRLSMDRLRTQPSPETEREAMLTFLQAASQLELVIASSENIAVVRGQTVDTAIPPAELAKMLREFALFLVPAGDRTRR